MVFGETAAPPDISSGVIRVVVQQILNFVVQALGARTRPASGPSCIALPRRPVHTGQDIVRFAPIGDSEPLR
jgi:hypothetical protein